MASHGIPKETISERDDVITELLMPGTPHYHCNSDVFSHQVSGEPRDLPAEVYEAMAAYYKSMAE